MVSGSFAECTFGCGFTRPRANLHQRVSLEGDDAWCDPCQARAAGKRMSQRDVERTLGRLLTDAGFRRDFFRNPDRACLELGVQLAAHEVDALLRVSPRQLASLAGQLDDRICRLDIEDVNDPGPPTGED